MIKTIDCGQNKEKIYASEQIYEKMKAMQKDRSKVNDTIDHAAANLRVSIKKVRRLIAVNFYNGTDWSAVLTFPRKTKTFKEASDEFEKFVKRVQYHAKKSGIEFKYLAVFSMLSSTTKKPKHIHIHMIVNDEAKKLIKKHWTVGHVKVSKHLYTENGDFGALARYLIDQSCSEGNRYRISRNLLQPKEDYDFEGNFHDFCSLKRKIEADATTQKIAEFTGPESSYLRISQGSVGGYS